MPPPPGGARGPIESAFKRRWRFLVVGHQLQDMEGGGLDGLRPARGGAGSPPSPLLTT